MALTGTAIPFVHIQIRYCRVGRVGKVDCNFVRDAFLIFREEALELKEFQQNCKSKSAAIGAAWQ